MNEQQLTAAKGIIAYSAENSAETEEIMLLGEAVKEIERLRGIVGKCPTVPDWKGCVDIANKAQLITGRGVQPTTVHAVLAICAPHVRPCTDQRGHGVCKSRREQRRNRRRSRISEPRASLAAGEVLPQIHRRRNEMIAKIAAILVLLVVWFGFVGPYCISAPYTELVLGWIFTTLVVVVLVAEWLRRKFINLKKGETK